MHYKCVFCGYDLSSPENYAGTKIHCRSCRNDFTIPQELADFKKPTVNSTDEKKAVQQPVNSAAEENKSIQQPVNTSAKENISFLPKQEFNEATNRINFPSPSVVSPPDVNNNKGFVPYSSYGQQADSGSVHPAKGSIDSYKAYKHSQLSETKKAVIIGIVSAIIITIIATYNLKKAARNSAPPTQLIDMSEWNRRDDQPKNQLASSNRAEIIKEGAKLDPAPEEPRKNQSR